jgi:hypothetical protein
MTTPRLRPSRRTALAAALALASSGCSVVFVHRPSADIDDPTIIEPCTRSPAPPIVDTAVAVGSAFMALVMSYVLAMESGFCGDDPECNTPGLKGLVIGSAALAVASTASAAYGYVTTSRCRRNVRMGDRCARGDVAACQALKPGWSPPAAWGAPPPGSAPADAPPPPEPPR